MHTLRCLRDTLTVMEIALAASLLVCAGLTLRTLHALVGVDLGFATENRFSFKTNLTERDYPDAARVDRFYEQLSTKLDSARRGRTSARSSLVVWGCSPRSGSRSAPHWASVSAR